MHAQFFEAWFIEHLIPSLPEKAVVIMDNASFHNKRRLKEIACQNKVDLIFLPPYSPELNPIEHFWYWLKNKLSDIIKFCKNLDEAISVVFKVL